MSVWRPSFSIQFGKVPEDESSPEHQNTDTLVIHQDQPRYAGFAPNDED